MKPEMRQQLAQLTFEEKIRKVGELIQLRQKIKTGVSQETAGEESEPRVPTDLRKALAAAPMAKAQWRDLTPIARSDFISWMDSAKQPETHRRRIEKACSMLAAGKRRP